jgi:hypothetical protein
MAIPIVLNEVSCEQWPVDDYASSACLRQLGNALAALSALPRKTFMLSHVRIGEMMLGNRPFASFMGDASVRDALRQFLSFGNRAPFASFADLDADGAECFLGPYSSRGALYAHLLGTVVVSFPTDDLWSGNEIRARISELDAVSGDIVDRQEVLSNVADLEHVAACAQAISKYRPQTLDRGSEIWVNRDEWFPSLRFLPRVENDLQSLLGQLITGQVASRLFELEAAASRWDPKSSQEPAWESRVTGEGETRKRLCKFIGHDGFEHIYDLHARYTPGAGRIHFRLRPAEGLIEIAYVGTKLGA